MIQYKSPNPIEIPGHMYKVFVAGGISNCPDWQTPLIIQFREYRCAMINPRREDFDINNKNMSISQIEWEYSRIEESDAMIFWFPKETLCPITLYELGRASASNKKLFIGCHPEYQRKIDVIKQISLVNDSQIVHESLEDLITEAKSYIETICDRI